MNPWYRVILPFNFEWIPINLMVGKLLWEILQLTRLLGYAQFKLRFLMIFWRILIDVQYIPMLKKNWFLLILFILKRCIYKGRSGLGRILKGALFIMRGQKVNNSHTLQDNIVIGPIIYTIRWDYFEQSGFTW